MTTETPTPEAPLSTQLVEPQPQSEKTPANPVKAAHLEQFDKALDDKLKRLDANLAERLKVVDAEYEGKVENLKRQIKAVQDEHKERRKAVAAVTKGEKAQARKAHKSAVKTWRALRS